MSKSQLPTKSYTNRPNAQESDSLESENVRKITYEFISKNMQNKPNFRNVQMNVTSLITAEYENIAINIEVADPALDGIRPSVDGNRAGKKDMKYLP